MALEALTLENILKIKGGLVNAMVARKLNQIVVDIEAAPDISEWREVTLKIKAKPVAEVNQGFVELKDVVVEFHVPGVKIPVRSTSIMACVRPATNGARQFHFQADAPDNPDQLTLLDDEVEASE